MMRAPNARATRRIRDAAVARASDWLGLVTLYINIQTKEHGSGLGDISSFPARDIFGQHASTVVR